MLSSEWRRFVSPILRRHSSHTRSRSGQNHLPHSSRRFYSTVRRRVINANTAEPSKIYSSTDSQWMAKKRKELDKEFDETFFRKPKVLIIGSDPSAMTAGMLTEFISDQNFQLILQTNCANPSFYVQHLRCILSISHLTFWILVITCIHLLLLIVCNCFVSMQ